jgi:hypothetical protein
MLTASVVRVDNSVVVDETQIWSQPALRGDGDIWRGAFSVPNLLRPTRGETIYLLLDDDRKVSAVVTGLDGPMVHFQAEGLVPKSTH